MTNKLQDGSFATLLTEADYWDAAKVLTLTFSLIFRDHYTLRNEMHPLSTNSLRFPPKSPLICILGFSLYFGDLVCTSSQGQGCKDFPTDSILYGFSVTVFGPSCGWTRSI